MIVEDEVAIANAVKGALVADGHAVDAVGDGRQALEWSETYVYDLVILDVILPGMDGLATCSALRSHRLREPPWC